MTTTDLQREALQRNDFSGIKPTYGYYRLPNGWIKPAVVTPIEELKYRREGWEPLPQYGRFDMGTGYAADHPLELLLINGGAAELCEDQIRQQGLYMNPPVLPTCRLALTQSHRSHTPRCWIGAKPVHLPQVAAMENLGPFDCRFCGTARQFPTIEARSQHEVVIHKEEKGNVRTGETLAESLVKGLSKHPITENKPEADTTTGKIEALTKEIAKLKRKRSHRTPHTQVKASV